VCSCCATGRSQGHRCLDQIPRYTSLSFAIIWLTLDLQTAGANSSTSNALKLMPSAMHYIDPYKTLNLL
jgi:hypothetical protein